MLATLQQPSTRRAPNSPRGTRTARAATARRISRKERARYVSLARFCSGLAVALLLVMTYVQLTARLTGLNYAVARAQRERATLLAESGRLDDRLAVLRSDDRLAAVAGRLGMREPQQFAVVALRVPVRPHERSHVAFLAGLASIFGAK